MRKLLLLFLIWGTSSNSVIAQSNTACLTIDTLFYFTFRYKDIGSRPIIMNAVCKTDSVEVNNAVDRESFIEEFYKKRFFATEYRHGLETMLEEKFGIELARYYLERNDIAIKKINYKLQTKSKSQRIYFANKAEVTITCTKIIGAFWVVNKNDPGISTNSDELNIQNIRTINVCYVPFEVKILE